MARTPTSAGRGFRVARKASTMVAAPLALAVVLAGATVGIIPEPAEAAVVCGERDVIVKALKTRYGESRRALGLQNGDRVLEVFASTNGTWTAVSTDVRGRTCIVGTGEAWTEFEAVPSGPAA